MGAELNAGTGKETTSVYARVLDVHLERGVRRHGRHGLAARASTPRSSSQEREIVLEEIAMYEDDPQDKVFDVLGEAVFGDHPLGRAIIGRARRRGRHAGRAAWPPSTPGATCPATSSSPPPARSTTTRSSSSSSAPGSSVRARSRRRRRATPPATEAPPRVRFVAKDTEQYHLCLGAPGIARDDERRFALRVLDNVLGGTSSSRLFQEVREKRGLAYTRLLVPGPLRGHRPGRPVPRHAAGQRRPALRRRGRRARALPRRTRPREASSRAPRRTSRAASCCRWSRRRRG